MEKNNNRTRLIKNTAFLYLRTFLSLVISLYTSRVVLSTLGIEDYGIYNVVGGFVAMFALVSASLTNSISRFITFELGRGDKIRLNRIFCTSINIQIVLSAIIIILAELVGAWFIYTKMNIPEGREFAALWVFQCSLLSFILGLISVPYNALIVAHEHMKAFAYIGLGESLLKLGAVYLLVLFAMDKLILYAILLTSIALFLRLVYSFYCRKHFEECHYHFILDKSLFREIGSFAGWYLFGTSAYIFNTQGVNLIINIFFGVVLNAARGVATQVDSAVRMFVNNFTTALNPQIIKTYAEGNTTESFKLVFKGAKFSFYLMLFFLIPLVLEADYVLGLWLKEVPPYAPLFLRLALFVALADLPGAPLTTLALGTGNIKRYYLYVGGFGCLVFPFTWLLFKLGCNPEIYYIIYILDNILLIFVRLFLLKSMVKFPVWRYVNEVLGMVLIVLLVCFILPVSIVEVLPASFGRLILTCIVSFMSTIPTIYYIGMTHSERNTVCNMIKNKLKIRKQL